MLYLSSDHIEVNPFLSIPGHQHYEIRMDGAQVRNKKTGNYLTINAYQAGCRYYFACSIGRIHRLLMSALVGRELTRTEYVCHANGNTFDNSHGNLWIASPRQNALDRIAANTYGRTLRNQDVREIRRLSAREAVADLARRYGVSACHIRRIIAGKSWANLP